MIGAYEDNDCWEKAFELLMEIINEERKSDPEFALQLEMIDEITDYHYDILGWLEDCLDELDMRHQYELLIKMCDKLLSMFEWPEYSSSGYKFQKSDALLSLGREKEALELCREWIEREPDNVLAATACVYALIKKKEYDKAEKLVKKYVPDCSVCTDENYVMFMAACKLYEASGEKKKMKQMDQIRQKYDEAAWEEFEAELYDDEEAEVFGDEFLPF